MLGWLGNEVNRVAMGSKSEGYEFEFCCLNL